MGSFDHLFHEFTPQETSWGDWCLSPQAYFRGDSDIKGSNFNVGFQVFLKPVFLEREPHFHREEEYLVFLGSALPDVFSSFDAEVEFFIGEKLDAMEKITITKPTIIKVPKGWWHSPLNFKRVDKPIWFQAAAMAGKFGSIKLRKDANGREILEYSGDEYRPCVLTPGKDCDYCGECFKELAGDPTGENAPAIEQYWTVKDGGLSPEVAELICELPPETTAWGDWCPTPQAYFRGDTYMPVSNYHCGFQVFTGDFEMEDAHFHQGVDEYIFYMGGNPMNFFDMDCEITMYIGNDPDHLEEYKITKPTVVRLPPTVWHSPIIFRNVKKPVLFQAAFLAGCWGTITRHKDENGVASYSYQGDNVRHCVKDPTKRCTVCGECFVNFAAPPLN